MPTFVPSADASSGVPATTLWIGRSRSACVATSTLMMLAGRCLPCGSLAAMTSPVSRSATSQASAEMSPGTGGVPGAVITPHPPSASPPRDPTARPTAAVGRLPSGPPTSRQQAAYSPESGQASGAPLGSALARAGLAIRKAPLPGR